MISCFFFTKEDDLQGWKSILCWNVTSLEKGKWLFLLPKDLKHNWHQRGKTNYDNDDYDDDDDDDDDDDYDDEDDYNDDYDDEDDYNDDYNVFSSTSSW